MNVADLPWPARDNQIKWLTKSGDVVVVFGFGSVLPRIHPDTKNTCQVVNHVQATNVLRRIGSHKRLSALGGSKAFKGLQTSHWREAVESGTARHTAFKSETTRPRVRNCNPLWAISDFGGR